jgi:hypothetical protein
MHLLSAFAWFIVTLFGHAPGSVPHTNTVCPVINGIADCHYKP